MENIKSKILHLVSLLDTIYVSDMQDQQLTLDAGLDRAYEMITQARTVWLCGNGGSLCQISHRALDLARVPITAIALDSSTRITANGNDLGQHQIFEAQLRGRMHDTDLLWVISGSGWSPDILCAVRLARRIGVKVLTFSGFDVFNPLRKLGHLNFWVPSSQYGQVEIIHEFLGHTITDLITGERSHA